ncbi:MAG: BPSS1780 family membrane protein [Pseudomonadota bacterium]
MTESSSYPAPKAHAEGERVPQSGNFDVGGRTVDAGRGWDWIVEAFALFRRQPGMWILTVVVLGILFIAIGMIPVLGSLASALLFPIFGAGLMLGCKDLDQGGTLEIAHLFAGFKRKTGDLVMIGVFNLIGWVVMALAVVAVIGGGVFMGLMRGGIEGAGLSIASMLIAALLVAGLSVPLYMATWFAPVLIVLHDLAPGAALKASFFACLRNWMTFLAYGVVLLVLGIVAAIPFGLGYLVLIPVLIASVYTAYRDIFCAGQAT